MLVQQMFEPADVALPCIKYPFRCMEMPLQPAQPLSHSSRQHHSTSNYSYGSAANHSTLRSGGDGGMEGVFTVHCDATVEMKANNR